MIPIRAVEELADVADPAWPAVLELVGRASVPVTVVPIEADAGRAALHRTQVGADTVVGALVLSCGGIVVDHGWLRVLGGGGDGLPDVAAASGLGPVSAGSADETAALVVAYDVLGGRFALNRGELPGGVGEVAYWGPDTLSWMPTEMDPAVLLETLLGGGLEDFYHDLRWPEWAAEVQAVGLDHGIAVTPSLHTVEGRRIAEAERSVVPFDRLVADQVDLAAAAIHG